MSADQSMRAVLVREFGTYANAAVGEARKPTPAAGEVLIEVHAAPVNFVDLIVIAGKYQFLPKLPFTPGKGPAGIVREIGAGVTQVKPGDRVLAMAEIGGYAEYAIAPAIHCYRLPDTLSFTDAGAMSLVFDTSWFALRERARIAPGETVLVLGASGGVGEASVQLAKAMGARVLAGVSRAETHAAVRAAGADEIIDLSRANINESLREQVFAVTGGKGADIVIDPLGGDFFDASLRALAWCGRLAVIGFAAGRIPSVKANYLLVKNIEVTGLQISDYRKRRPEQVAECYHEVFALYEAGKIKAPRVTTLPLSEVQSALRMIEERKATGRVILLPRS